MRTRLGKKTKEKYEKYEKNLSINRELLFSFNPQFPFFEQS
jgi:hypothetical protein